MRLKRCGWMGESKPKYRRHLELDFYQRDRNIDGKSFRFEGTLWKMFKAVFWRRRRDWRVI
jgi:hypothetical protein